jgi:[citrate (pro-3S)-lyase] ligase
MGTASKSFNILKCIAIDDSYRGENITSILVNAMLDKLFEENILNCFVFTKKINTDIFLSLGFSLIQSTDKVALLEFGAPSIKSTINNIITQNDIDITKPKSAIVMNCNPFTLGHKYLIEKASSESFEVLVFLLEEDLSVFPFDVRFYLAKEGTKHLPNVKIIKSTQYIISKSTFPTYFLKKYDDMINSYVNLDAHIFGKYFSKLNITTRYVGEEKTDFVTNEYNKALIDVLPIYGIKVKEIKRVCNNYCVISASSVRSLLKNEAFEKIENYVPLSTYEYLKSDASKNIILNIRGNK